MLNIPYLRRILSAYIFNSNSQLSFWHETPAVNLHAGKDPLGQYFMTFADKALYAGPFDEQGIPLLDYRGDIGKQYNPIAIAQYGLGNFNLFKQNNDMACLKKSVAVADWLTDNLTQNKSGIWVWNHMFDWEYFRTLHAPWYSGLAQGQGISALLRIFSETGNIKYRDAADKAFQSLLVPISDGGVLHVDSEGLWWIEEYIVDPPTHIINGFMWAVWGVYDYMKLTHDKAAEELWRQSLKTLRKKITEFENEYWSLYDLPATGLSNVASFFYHSLHIVQLRIMAILSDDMFFNDVANKWELFRQKPLNRKRALLHKAVFKIIYY